MTAWWELETTLEKRKTRFVSWSNGAKELRVLAGFAAEQATEKEIAERGHRRRGHDRNRPGGLARICWSSRFFTCSSRTTASLPALHGSLRTVSAGHGRHPHRGGRWSQKHAYLRPPRPSRPPGRSVPSPDERKQRDAEQDRRTDQLIEQHRARRSGAYGEREGAAQGATAGQARSATSTQRCRAVRGRGVGRPGHRRRLPGVPVDPRAGLSGERARDHRVDGRRGGGAAGVAGCPLSQKSEQKPKTCRKLWVTAPRRIHYNALTCGFAT